jgi:RNA polymerase sigma factor (sigma-70 family)
MECLRPDGNACGLSRSREKESAVRYSDACGSEPDAVEPIGDVVELAQRGEGDAWRTLIDRCLPIIRAVGHRYRLPGSDIDDMTQIVCLKLFENLDDIRTPQALPGWIVTTARRECLRLVRRQSQLMLMPSVDELDGRETHGNDADLLRAELAQALREGLAELTHTQRDLLLLLTDGQPHSYREIGRLLAMPVGSIGPTRARGLARLRRSPAVVQYLAAS